MKYKILTLIFSSLLLGIQGYTQTSLSKRIDSALSDIVKSDEPGFSIGVVKNGKFIYSKGYGLADLETKRRNEPETPFNVASNSKEITAACIYLLEEQGKLKTSDKLSKYFRGWPKYADSITINQLIHHKSGLMDFSTLRALMRIGDFKKDKTNYQLLLAQKQLNFTPGKEYSYTNSGYFLLSLIIRKLSGQDLSVYANQKIFQPLHMNNTGFSRSHQVKEKANGYILNNNKYTKNNATDTTIGQSNVYSTIIDWNKWLLEMKNHKVLGDMIWAKMLSPADTINKYGGGLAISKRNNKVVISHGGDIDGYHSNFYYFPEDTLGFIIFSNKGDVSISDIYKRSYGVFYKETPKIEKKAEKNIEAKKINIPYDTLHYVGSYRLQSGVVITISNKNSLLHAEQLWDGSSYDLVPNLNHKFHEPADTSVTFEFKALEKGLSQNLEIFQDGEVTVWKRISLSSNLNEYCGKFFNSELGTTYSFILKDNDLLFSSNKEPIKLRRTDVDSFDCDYGTIDFTRNKNNIIDGLILHHIRVQNLKFVKVAH